ncbi:hypothetical protein AGMMS50293_06750 [Spirochaetia bacterium]|nr:hypothetical protein AGMMS50293_06750 [Spirochaetia bacterium]
MKHTNKLAFFSAALFAALLALVSTACDMAWVDSKSFDYDLRGTWETNTPTSPDGYVGRLVIGYNHITITGYTGSISNWPSSPDENTRPFGSFGKGVKYEGYSEEGKLYIGNAAGIPYHYDTSSPPVLTFYFGKKIQILHRISTDY